MFLLFDECYHIYNRGNNRQPIFFNPGNYLFFLKKLRAQVLPVADILAYCLMPNYFHLIIHANENSIKERKSFGGKPMQELAYRLGQLQSSYAQAINKQNNTTGSLFQQKTKCKILTGEEEGKRVNYLANCLHYIHYNPKQAGLVNILSDWPYSSYTDYREIRNGTLCNKALLFQLTGLTAALIKDWREEEIPAEEIKNFY
jgi:putative transposase